MKKTLKNIVITGLLGLGLVGCGHTNFNEGIVENKTYDSMAKSLVFDVKATNGQKYIISVCMGNNSRDIVPVDALAEYIGKGDRITFPMKYNGKKMFNNQNLGEVEAAYITRLDRNLEDNSKK